MDTFFAEAPEHWRAWLVENHALARDVWLVFFKKHVKKPCISYEEAVDEALCFGWIDSMVRRIDDDQYVLRFSPRKPGGNWTEGNLAKVRRLIEEGKMTPSGLAKAPESARGKG